MALTALDHAQIRSLMGAYCFAIDLGTAEEYVALFTEDAVLDVDGLPDGHPFGQTRVGRAALADLHRILESGTGRKGRHLAMNIEIVDGADDTSATARCYLLTLAAGSPATPGASGLYRDELRKVDGQWLYSRRHCTLDT